MVGSILAHPSHFLTSSFKSPIRHTNHVHQNLKQSKELLVGLDIYTKKFCCADGNMQMLIEKRTFTIQMIKNQQDKDRTPGM